VSRERGPRGVEKGELIDALKQVIRQLESGEIKVGKK